MASHRKSVLAYPPIEFPNPPAERVVLKGPLFSRPVPSQLANQPRIDVILEALVLEHLEPVMLNEASGVIARHQVPRFATASHRNTSDDNLGLAACSMRPVHQRNRDWVHIDRELPLHQYLLDKIEPTHFHRCVFRAIGNRNAPDLLIPIE